MPPRTSYKGIHDLEVRDAARLSLVLGVMYPTFNNVTHGGVSTSVARCHVHQNGAKDGAQRLLNIILTWKDPLLSYVLSPALRRSQHYWGRRSR